MCSRKLTRRGVFFLELLPILRGQHTRVAPILRVDLVDDNVDVFRLFAEVVNQGCCDFLHHFLFLLGRDPIAGDFQIYVRHIMILCWIYVGGINETG